MRSTELEQFLSKTFTKSYYEVYDLSVKHTLSLVFDIMQKLSILGEIKGQFKSFEELKENLDLSSNLSYPFKWLLDFASENGLLIKEKKKQKGILYSQ